MNDDSNISEDLDQQFLVACETGNIDDVLNIFYYDDNGPTRLLQTDPANINHMHYFHAACFNGHHDVVEQLIVFKVDVNLDSVYGTPLSVACQGGNLDTVKVLVKHNAIVFDPNSRDSTLSPIFQACKHGHCNVLTYLLSQAPEALDVLGHQLLVQACHDGFLEIVVLLISKDVDINGICDYYSAPNSCIQVPMDVSSISPLHAACSQRNIEVVEYLLQEGAKVTVDLVDHFYSELGEAVNRNFKDYSGKFKKDKSRLLYADFRACSFHAIHQDWFSHQSHFDANQLVEIDVSNNYLQNIPKVLFNLSCLKKIDVSGNGLFDLPEIEDVYNSSLQEIVASSNKLSCLPLSFFQLKTLRHLNVATNEIQSLEAGQNYSEIDNYMADDLAWQCTALKSFNLAKNKLTAIPLLIHAAKSLEKLQVSDNNLESFPIGWKCPLRILDLAKNELGDFQESIFTTWKQTLEDLNLRRNKLSEIAWDICQLDALQRLDLGENKIEAMPPKSYWTCRNLRRLILDNNKLCGGRSAVTTPVIQKRFSLVRSPSHQDDTFIEDEFAHEVYGGTLETLDLSNNQLSEVPSSVCRLTSLEELLLSGNRNLRTLPPELGNLTECHQLGLERLNLTGIPKYVRPGRNVSSKSLLTYLRAKQRKAVPYYRMKLMVIGLQGRGKTTLLAALRGKPLPPNISTVGIVVNEWKMDRSQSLFGKLSKSSPTITFSTWDLAGQQIYYSTHQCFLSSNTLYVAVWNVSHGEKGIEKLKPWLLNVQARAPGSHVIIVGTHVDLLPEKVKTKRIHELRLAINKKYDKKGYPLIKGNCVVSCTTGENITQLRQDIYEAAVDLKESENAMKGEPLIGRKIPLSYLKLQENVLKEAKSRNDENKPPILNEEEMLELAKQDSNNDIFSREELVLASRFLHENGVILHYDDRSRGLDKLYFIEPGWLCDIMALLVTVKENNNFVKGGIVQRSNVNLLLKSPRLPVEFMDQYIQLMERFEVALILDDTRLLVPSMLPRDKPGLDLSHVRRRAASGESSGSKGSEKSDEDNFYEETTTSQSEYLIRLYKMNYVPSGFWSRLIARLMIAVQKWGAEEGLGDELICSEGGKAVRTQSVRPVPHGYSMIYWREGVGVVYEGGHLMVESFAEKERNSFTEALEDIEGVKVTVWSAEQDFSVLGFVTDQINSLISEWYPGLEENDNFGVPLVRHVIPCPTCAVRVKSLSAPSHRVDSINRMQRTVSMDSLSSYEQRKNQEFTLTECAAAAVRHKEITCPAHMEEPVKLESLVPDLMLSDLPDDLLIDSKLFDFRPVEENRLGSGGAGEVFLGSYKKQRVAIKRFYSTREAWRDSGIHSDVIYIGNHGKSRHTDGGSFAHRRVFATTVPTLEEELQRTKILSSFWELRQEVSVLARLSHPCVVALVGVSVQPLSIVLELSPLGSLFSILENELRKEENERFMNDTKKTIDIRDTIFERDLTYKIVYQVAHALRYLHSLGIIYRDLKSDNLLVWSLDKHAIVHVKLSDYGISRFATPQGMLGEEGTPGFQAPEVRTGAMYNEKVDVFSFAMVIYEILSGYRPFYECRCSAQIKKAVRRGERPSLERNSIDSKMPDMEALMEKCWRESINNRPSTDAILDELEDPSFLCLTRVLPYADQTNWTNITAFIPLSTQDKVLHDSDLSKGGHSVLLWGGECEERSYSVVDCHTGFFQIKETLCVGARVACLAKVGDRYWLGTEGSAVEVFGRASLGSDLRVLWSYKVKAPVLSLLVDQEISKNTDENTEPYIRRVFASLANGTVVVISRPEYRKTSSTSTSLAFKADATEKLRQEAAIFSVMTTVEVGDHQSPACCMVLCNDGKELWVGCRNHIIIVDVDSLQVCHKFRVYVSPRSNVRAMVTNGLSVFTINRQSASFLQWDIASRRLLYKFNCSLENLKDAIIAQKIVSKEDDPSQSCEIVDDNGDTTSPQQKTNEGNVLESPEEPPASTPDRQADLQLLPDVPKIHPRPPSLMRTLKRQSSRKKNEHAAEPVSITISNTSHAMRSRTHVISSVNKRITTALVVDGNLWLGRVTGDIIVVDVSCMDDEGYGRVLAVLSVGKEHGYLRKEINCLEIVGGNTVVSCGCLSRDRKHQKISQKCATSVPTKASFVASTSPFKTLIRSSFSKTKSEEDELPSEKNQLAIWERWNSNDFRQFYKYHTDLENQ